MQDYQNLNQNIPHSSDGFTYYDQQVLYAGGLLCHKYKFYSEILRRKVCGVFFMKKNTHQYISSQNSK